MTEKRLAKGSDGKERPWAPRELYMLYARGVRDGAGSKAMRSDHADVPAYDEGYAAGKIAAGTLIQSFAERIGYSPTILRLQDLADGSIDEAVRNEKW